MKRVVLTFILALLCGSCSPKQSRDSATSLTEAQRDSVLSRSDIPGANAVGSAAGASDMEAKHSADVNAMVDSLPH